MSFSRLRFAVVVALLGMILMPATALAHDDYEDPFEMHPFKLAAETLHVAGFTVDRLVVRPLHWMMNAGPMNTLTGHDKMNTRLPADDLDEVH